MAWEQAGREEGSATAEERLELAQMCAMWDQREGEPEGQAEPMAGPAASSRERQQQRGRGGAERGDGAARGQGQRGPPVDDLRQMMMSVLTTGLGAGGAGREGSLRLKGQAGRYSSACPRRLVACARLADTASEKAPLLPCVLSAAGAAPVTEAQTAAWMALPKDRPVKPEDMGPDCVIM